MLRNHLFINYGADETEQPVWDSRLAKLTRAGLLVANQPFSVLILSNLYLTLTMTLGYKDLCFSGGLPKVAVKSSDGQSRRGSD